MFDDLEMGKQLPTEVLDVQVQHEEVLQVEVEMRMVEGRRRLLLIDSSLSSGFHLERLSFHPLLACRQKSFFKML